MKANEIENATFYDSLDTKKEMIDEQLKHQEEKKNVLFEYCNTIMNVISIADNVDNNWDEILKELKETMEVIAINMHELQNLKNNINEIEELARNVEQTKDGDEKNKKIENLVSKLEEFNKNQAQEYPRILDKTRENENLINKIIKNANEILEKQNEIKENEKTNETVKNIEEQENKTTKIGFASGKIYNNKKEVSFGKETENKRIEENKNISEENINTIREKTDEIELKDNKVLVVSEMAGKVYLPYLMSDIEKLVNESKGKTAEEIIKEKYVLNISKFKNPITARFRESYNLIRKKEKKGFIEAIDLGLELMLNYSLNPAVIAACRNEDELDIYLDCLEENELEQFDIFDIKYVSAPMIVNKRIGRHAYE